MVMAGVIVWGSVGAISFGASAQDGRAILNQLGPEEVLKGRAMPFAKGVSIDEHSSEYKNQSAIYRGVVVVLREGHGFWKIKRGFKTWSDYGTRKPWLIEIAQYYLDRARFNSNPPSQPHTTLNIIGRGLSAVDWPKLEAWSLSREKISYTNIVRIQISAQLPLDGITRYSIGFEASISSASRLSESYENQAQAENAERHSNDGRYSNSPSPSGHYALGLKIAFITLAFICGLAFLRNAFTAIREGDREAFAFNGYVAGVGIGLSASGSLLLYFELLRFG